MIAAENLAKIIEQHPFAEHLEKGDLERLTKLAKGVSFVTDQVIFREGDECGQFYLIRSGRVALEILAPGRIFRIQTLGPGDEFGWSALLMRKGKHFQARALEAVEAVAFEGNEVLAACKEDTKFGLELMHRVLGVVYKRLQATRLQILDIYAPKVK